MAFVLPQIEQTNIDNSINFSRNNISVASNDLALQDPNVTAWRSSINSFLCPSDQVGSGKMDNNLGARSAFQRRCDVLRRQLGRHEDGQFKPWFDLFVFWLGSLLITGCNTSDHDNVAFAVCPDGRSIVFAAADGGMHRLTLDTHNVSNVLTGPAPSTMPTISPDGKDVVYVATAPGRQGTSLFSRPLDGSGPAKQLTNAPGVADSSPTFAPDGRIAFLRALRHRARSMGGSTWENFDIYIMASDGSAPRRVGTKTFTMVNGLCFVEGGSRLILAGYTDGSNTRLSLFRGDTVGTGEFERMATPDRPAPNSAAWGSEPSASLDGHQIVAISDRTIAFKYDVILINPDGSPIRSLGLTQISHYNRNPVVMPGGQSILFLAGEFGIGSSKPRFSLWQVNIDGSSPHRIAGTQLFSSP